jgi:hypothetical protein
MMRKNFTLFLSVFLCFSSQMMSSVARGQTSIYSHWYLARVNGEQRMPILRSQPMVGFAYGEMNISVMPFDQLGSTLKVKGGCLSAYGFEAIASHIITPTNNTITFYKLLYPVIATNCEPAAVYGIEQIMFCELGDVICGSKTYSYTLEKTGSVSTLVLQNETKRLEFTSQSPISQAFMPHVSKYDLNTP